MRLLYARMRDLDPATFLYKLSSPAVNKNPRTPGVAVQKNTISKIFLSDWICNNKSSNFILFTEQNPDLRKAMIAELLVCAAGRNIPTAVFTKERSDVLFEWMVCHAAGMDTRDAKNVFTHKGGATLIDAIAMSRKSPIWVDDSLRPSVTRLLSQSEKLIRTLEEKKPLRLLVIDYATFGAKTNTDAALQKIRAFANKSKITIVCFMCP